MPILQTDAEEIVTVAIKQSEISQKFKQNKMRECLLNEELYANKAKKALRGQYNIPLPIMSGFVDTFQSKIDEPVKIVFGHDDEADLKRAMRVTAAWEKDSAPDRGKWSYIDRGGKKMALISGRGSYIYYSYRNPAYQSSLEAIGYLDFECEPSGKNHLDNHLFLGRRNIFRAAYELEQGAKDELYIKENVAKLVTNQDQQTSKVIDDAYNLKSERQEIYRLDIQRNN